MRLTLCRLVSGILLAASCAWAQSQPVITEFPNVPGNPAAITTGPDGAIWFTERLVNQIGRLALPTGGPLQITTSNLPTGATGTAYSQTLTATGGTPPYAWSLSSGSLPAGLTLSTSGIISGTARCVSVAGYRFPGHGRDSCQCDAGLCFNDQRGQLHLRVRERHGKRSCWARHFPSVGRRRWRDPRRDGAGLPWYVSGAPIWITTTMSPSGQLGTAPRSPGSGTIPFSALPNYGPDSREGSFTVQGTVFSVNQQAGLIQSAGLMPHLAAEGGWTTTFTLVNKGSFDAVTQLNLLDNNGNPLAVPFSFPQQASAGPTTEASASPIIANASWIAQASGPANVPYVEGGALMSSAGAVDGFAIFHYDPSGQEAVVPLTRQRLWHHYLSTMPMEF